jgi:hypothetical protein
MQCFFFPNFSIWHNWLLLGSSCQFGNLQLFGVDQYVYSCKLENWQQSQIKSTKIRGNHIDMQNNNQVGSKVGKWLPNGTPCRQIGKQLQFNGGKNGKKMQKLVDKMQKFIDINYL